MKKLPKLRTEDVVVQKVGNCLYVYDQHAESFFCLDETSATVFLACEQQMSFDELKNEKNLSDEIIFSSLDKLKRKDLLAYDKDKTSLFHALTYFEQVRETISTSKTPAIHTLF